MGKKPNESPAIQFLRLVWESTNEENGDSWTRLNWTMRKALHLAAAAGFRFGIDDCKIIDENFRPGYWLGESHYEDTYATAIAARNPSAWKAIEHYLGRTPIIADTLDDGRARLYVGSRLRWRGEVATVTSWNDGYVVACTYGERIQGRRKLKHQFKIARQDVIDERKRVKSWDALFTRVCAGDSKQELRARKYMRRLNPKRRGSLTEKEVRALTVEELQGLVDDIGA